jgi:hypothetical protein
MYQKLKQLCANDLVFTSILFCGVAVISFWLGQQSVAATPARVTTAPASASTVTLLPPALSSASAPTVVAETNRQPTSGSGQYVASKSGTKFHALNCPGAKQIKAENKIYFESIAAAEAAGYTKAGNCPSL